MSKTLFTLTLIGTLGLFAVAQDSRVTPPLTALGNPQANSAPPSTEPVIQHTTSPNLAFCPKKTCLYYAGDFDSTDSSANGLFNANDSAEGLEGQTWVGVKPPKATTVTGATFNEFFSSGFTGTNPTPFLTQVGMSQGGNGKLICNTSGNAILRQYGESDFGYVQYSYTIRKLKQACIIAKPTKQYPSTYINLLPTTSNGYGYVTNVEDARPKNHRGWTNDLDDCYFSWIEGISACSTQGTFDEFSIALTGRQ
jgi:hypothetical protein